MRHDTVTPATNAKVDWEGIGYIGSIVGVLLLGAMSWPGPADPAWHEPALIAGMATAIAGMLFRYQAHLDQKREVQKAKAEARRS